MDKFYTASELAERIGIKKNTIRCWVSRGMIPYTRINGAVRFSESQITAMLERGRHELEPVHA